MGKYMQKLEIWIEKAIWNPNKLHKDYILIPCLTRILLAEEYENISKRKCPYCYFQALQKSSLYNHITVKHHESYYSDIKRVVHVYLKLRKAMIRKSSGIVIDLPNLPRAKFVSVQELCIWIDLNKDIILPILTQ